MGSDSPNYAQLMVKCTIRLNERILEYNAKERVICKYVSYLSQYYDNI